jgi:hypothetical protein
MHPAASPPGIAANGKPRVRKLPKSLERRGNNFKAVPFEGHSPEIQGQNLGFDA